MGVDFFQSQVSDRLGERETATNADRALEAWARLEDALDTLFVRLTGLPSDMGMALLHAAGPKARTDMLAVCIEYSRCSPPARRFLRQALDRAVTYRTAFESLSTDQPSAQHHPTASEVIRIRDNFDLLGAAVDFSIAGGALVRAPELGLEVLDLLAREAHLQTADLNRTVQLIKQIARAAG